VSLRSLERFFKESKATTPHQWLHLQRLLQAKSVLLESESIKQAAYMLGYKQPNHFTREFKKHFGESPSNFLNEAVIGDGNTTVLTQLSRMDTNRRV
jgi:AraC-like DNA-binding protein